ncbi:MAG: hypothetical protein R3B72_51450 [Polyangiaceae bacterium]
MKAWMVVGTTLCGLWLLACGGPVDDGEGASGSGASGSTGSGASTGGPSSGSGGSTGTGTGTGSGGSTTGSGGGTSTGSGTTACGQLATWSDCEVCECDANPAGCETYWTLQEDSCYCGSSAPCQSACTTYCTTDTEELDQACLTCDQGLDDTCFEAADASCAQDSTCDAYAQALYASCDALPDP